MSARGVRPGMLHHKENNPADAQAGKRQRTATGAGRQPLSAAAPPPPPSEEPIVFEGREDVEALLNEKMKGKNKMDYKVTQTPIHDLLILSLPLSFCAPVPGCCLCSGEYQR
ncbi:hypothetical protein BAE44_0023412 [Dichanthelium oligosanthes]|uniref:Uncharacterized protein n=1 Tax=Dichanthelium oligosanthes TaxID=888268 RepID=A0A1E5URP4_9POAL|nr:hypothetical protein BAE44_0023412 [Dichanthelium oligosanthes]